MYVYAICTMHHIHVIEDCYELFSVYLLIPLYSYQERVQSLPEAALSAATATSEKCQAIQLQAFN